MWHFRNTYKQFLLCHDPKPQENVDPEVKPKMKQISLLLIQNELTKQL